MMCFTRTLFCFSSPRWLGDVNSPLSLTLSHNSFRTVVTCTPAQWSPYVIPTGVMLHPSMCDVASNWTKNNIFPSTQRTSLSRLHLNFLPSYWWLIFYIWLCQWLLDEFTFSTLWTPLYLALAPLPTHVLPTDPASLHLRALFSLWSTAPVTAG